jgi:hypothetical protein
VQKSALAGRSGGGKRHVEHQNLVRQKQFLLPKFSSVQHSDTQRIKVSATGGQISKPF